MDNNNYNKLQLGFIHRFIPPSNKSELRARQGEGAGEKILSTTFLLLHGTGINEDDLCASTSGKSGTLLTKS